MTLNRDLFDILACPKCKGEIKPTHEEDGLICEQCGLVYPIREEIPIMIAEEAVGLDDWRGGKRRAGED